MKCLYGPPVEKEEVQRQKREGEKISEIVLCRDFLYHHYFFRTRYIPYSGIRRAYLQIELGESGDFSMEDCAVMLLDGAGCWHKLHVDRAEYGKEVLTWLAAHHPDIVIGRPLKSEKSDSASLKAASGTLTGRSGKNEK